MKKHPEDVLEFGKRYQLEVYFPDTNIVSRFYIKNRALSHLDTTLDCGWVLLELEDTDFLKYSLKIKGMYLTHGGVFDLIKQAYDLVMWIDCLELGLIGEEDGEGIPGEPHSFWDYFLAIFFQGYFWGKSTKKGVDWLEENKWIVLGVIIAIIVVYFMVRGKAKPSIVVVK